MMANDHREGQICKIMERSPKSLARKIESCIVRNALNEERRAQKALYLLESRDRQIAFLEKRVAELESIAENIHDRLSLPSSSKQSIPEAVSDKTTNDETENTPGTSNENTDTVSESKISIPSLKLSKSSHSNSAKDIFSTAIDFSLEMKQSSSSATRISNENQSFENASARRDKNLESKSEMKFGGSSNRERDDANLVLEEGRGNSVVFMKRLNQKLRKQRCSFPRTSSSVPWIRAKHGFRKKLRNFELRGERRVEEIPVGDGHACTPVRKIETDRRQEREQGIVDGAKKIEKSTVAREQDVQGTHVIAGDGVNNDVKTICTQTSINSARQINEKDLHSIEKMSNAYQSSSYTCFEQKKSTKFDEVDEEPAPQWLIEEALNRASERSERWTKGKISSSKEIEHEQIIAELETKLTQANDDLEEALRSKSLMKEKYKRSLDNFKMEARRENEMLQDKIVRICTFILEKFGPNSMTDKRKNTYQIKYHSRSKYHRRTLSKLHKKLRMAATRSSKLEYELMAARSALKNKSEMYESISKYFDELKRDMYSTEMNLNNLISENLALRKKMEETRNWLEEHNAQENYASNRFREVQKTRDLTNLKKQIEEDKNTITQLRNRLMRSESVNANKGFLLNSYKSQLTDLTQKKDQLVSKIKSLENEISAVKNNNSQLKAKISLLSIEKEKLHSDNEKSKTDITEKIETQCAQKCELAIQQKTEIIKNKYENIIKTLKTKMVAYSNKNSEYSKAIKEFLRQIYSQESYESPKNAKVYEIEESEREAKETACNILNMTPEELSGFINGKTPNSNNSWIIELNRIMAENHFSENLSKFLLKKAMKKLKSQNIQ